MSETLPVEPPHDSKPHGPKLHGPKPHGLSAGQRLRNYFLTGVIISGPLVITVYLSLWIINWVDGWVKPIIPSIYLPETYLPFAIPGFGILVLIVGLTMLGFLTANLVGRTLLEFGESLLSRMPVVRGLYRSMKQIFETIFSQSGTSFRTVALVEYPAPGCWSIVFLSSQPSPEIATGLPRSAEFISVFLPCAPNPTTGFFFYVPREKVIEVPISVDDAAKIVMSLGLLRPGEEEPKKAAIEAVARLEAREKREKPALAREPSTPDPAP